MTEKMLIQYGDSWKKIEDNVIEFYAIMIACADYPIGLRNYSDIDDIINADDYEETIGHYRELAKQMINFNRLSEKLWKENEWLKKSIKRQQSSNEECSKYIEEVVKENEQLKSTNMEMEDYLGRLEEQIKELEKENQEMNKK